MPILKIRDSFFDANTLVLDKDGTLIDFQKLWGSRIVSGTEAIISACKGDYKLRERIFYTVGYIPEYSRVLGCGPFATAPISQLQTVVATVLYQTGIPWDDSNSLVAEHFTDKMTNPPSVAEISPRENVVSFLQELRDAGMHLAIATTDNRLPTERCLEIIGIRKLIGTLLCGDEKNGPSKPDPSVLIAIAKSFETSIDQVIMVGDTVSDLNMAKTAGAFAIAITDGVGTRTELEQQADIVIDSLDDISVISKNAERKLPQ